MKVGRSVMELIKSDRINQRVFCWKGLSSRKFSFQLHSSTLK